MKKQQLLDRLDQAWTAFRESYAGLSENQLTEPGTLGDWSVKDIIAHVSTWEEEALKAAPLILKESRLPRYSVTYGGINAFNARRAEEKRALSIAEALKQQHETHQRLIEMINSAPDEQFTRETRFRRRLRLDTYSHYAEHEKAIRAWRERSGHA